MYCGSFVGMCLCRSGVESLVRASNAEGAGRFCDRPLFVGRGWDVAPMCLKRG